MGASNLRYLCLYFMVKMLHIDPMEIPTPKRHGHLLGSVGPRPIAFASTLSTEGVPNLSPFSFFNVFSANPPVMIFSPARRVRDNTTKHTLQNAKDTGEVVVNVVNYPIVQQMSLSSTEYPKEVNEFEKAGLTMLPSHVVKPFRVAESPVHFECKVREVVPLGEEGGAGNLIICEVLRIHISEEVLDENGRIDQHKIDLVARMGGNWYSRSNQGLFEVPKPLSTLGIGVDALPEYVRSNPHFTGNDLGMLANVEHLPSKEAVSAFADELENTEALLSEDTYCAALRDHLEKEDVLSAWKLILAKNETLPDQGISNNQHLNTDNI